MPRPRFALLAIFVATAVAAAGAVPAVAAGPSKPSVAACALGTTASDLRGFAARELERAERRFGSSRAARRAFSTAAAAYLYGVAPLSVGQTVQRFPLNQVVSIGALVDPTVKTVVAPNVDTTYTVAQLNVAAEPLIIDVRIRAGATTCFSCLTLTRTPSATSAGGPPAPRPARGRSYRPASAARCRPASGGSRAPPRWFGCSVARWSMMRPTCPP